MSPNFNPFPRLPPELRDQIYLDAIIPRIVHVGIPENPSQPSFRSRCPIPRLLHTSREARAALMNAGYTLTFRTRTSGPQTWFNIYRDTLLLFKPHIPNHHLCHLDLSPFDPSDLRPIRHLALTSPCSVERAIAQITPLLSLLPNLDTLSLVHVRLDQAAAESLRTRARQLPSLAAPSTRAPEPNRLWQFEETDVTDRFSHYLEHGECPASGTGVFIPDIKFDGPEETCARWTDSVSGTMRSVMEGLEAERDKEPAFQVPEVKLVHMGTAHEVAELRRLRAAWRVGFKKAGGHVPGWRIYALPRSYGEVLDGEAEAEEEMIMWAWRAAAIKERDEEDEGPRCAFRHSVYANTSSDDSEEEEEEEEAPRRASRSFTAVSSSDDGSEQGEEDEESSDEERGHEATGHGWRRTDR